MTDAGLGDALGKMSTQKVAAQGANGHHGRLGPGDETRNDEPNRGDQIDHRAKNGLEAVHLVDVVQPDEAQGSQHENPDAGAEVAATGGDGELERDGPPHGMMVVGIGFGLEFDLTSQKALRQKDDGCKEDQERHETGEGLVAGVGQQEGAQNAAQQAHGQKPPKPGFYRREVLAVTVDAAGGADDQCQSAGRIGCDRRRAEEEQGGEGDQGPPAGDGIDRAAAERG